MIRTSSQILRLRLAPSRILARLVFVAYGGGTACAFLCGMPFPVAGLIAALAIWSMARDLRRYVWLSSPGAVVDLRRRADGAWELQSRAGGVARASLAPRAYVHPWVVALLFRTTGGRIVRVPIVVDMVEREAFRNLRMIVRTGQ